MPFKPSMTFKEALRAGIDNATNFEDRASRAEFWWWALLVGFLLAATVALSLMLPFSAAFSGFLLLISMVPTVSLSVRRLHDLDRPGTELLWALVPLLGWAYVLMRFTEPGDPARNQYGRR